MPKSPLAPLLCALPLGALIALSGCDNKPVGGGVEPAAAATPEPGTPVTLAPVRSDVITRTIPVTGNIAATGSVQLAAKLSARIVFVAGREGDMVRRGQVVLRQETLDLAPQVKQAEAGVAQARANVTTARARLAQAQTNLHLQTTAGDAAVEDAQQQLKAAQAQLEIARRPQRTQELTVAESAVALAQANYDKSVIDRTRYEALVAEGAAAQAALDQYVTAERVARASLDTTRAQLDLARTGGRDESIQQALTEVRRAEWGVRLARSNTAQLQVRRDEVSAAQASQRQAEAAVASAEAQLAQVRQQVDNATITSPLDGVISQRNAEPGQLVGPGSPALTIVSLGTIYFEAQVPEVELARLKVGAPVSVVIDAFAGRSFVGRVARLNPTGNTNARAFTVRVEVQNTRGLLRPGMFARGSVIAERKRALVVSKDALVQTEDGHFAVFIAQGGKAVRRTVRLGIQNAEVAEVLSGLSPTDHVVLQGQGTLVEGASIRTAAGK